MKLRRRELLALAATLHTRAWADDAIQLPRHRSEVSRFPTLQIARPKHVPTDPGLIFFVQHSLNDNVICFGFKSGTNGVVDPRDPIDVFWRRYEEEGQRRELNVFERMFAYGVSVDPIEAERSLVRLVSFTERAGLFDRKADGSPRLTVPVAGEMARPVYVYAQAIRGGFIPKIQHVDLWAVSEGRPGYIRERVFFD